MIKKEEQLTNEELIYMSLDVEFTKSYDPCGDRMSKAMSMVRVKRNTGS